jgi:hypothetical protein
MKSDDKAFRNIRRQKYDNARNVISGKLQFSIFSVQRASFQPLLENHPLRCFAKRRFARGSLKFSAPAGTAIVKHRMSY